MERVSRHTKEGDRRISQESHDGGAGSFANTAAVFIEGDIADPVEAVFDWPWAPTQGWQAGRIGSLKGETGNPINGFSAVFLGEDWAREARMRHTAYAQLNKFLRKKPVANHTTGLSWT